MNKLLIALGLAAAVVLVGVVQKKKHLKQAQRQVNTLKMLLNKQVMILIARRVKQYLTLKKQRMKQLQKLVLPLTKLLRKLRLLLKMLKMPLKKQQLMSLAQ